MEAESCKYVINCSVFDTFLYFLTDNLEISDRRKHAKERTFIVAMMPKVEQICILLCT